MGIVQRIAATGATAEDPELIEAVRDSVRAFAKTRPAHDSAVDRAEEWRQVAEAGWLGLLAEEGVGGSALSVEIMAALHEELGRGGVTRPYSAVTTLSLIALDQCAEGKLRDALLSGLVAGEACPVLCWQEQPGQDEQTLPFVALDAGAGPVAFTRILIDLADMATHFCIPAERDGTPGLILLERNHPGAILSLVPSLSGSEVGHLAFNGEIPSEAFLPFIMADALAPAFRLTRIAAAAQLSGLCAQINAMTADYAGQRVQFGKAIATNQVVQHRLVDMWMEQTLAAAAVAYAARSCGAEQEAELASLAAKARAWQAADVVTRGAFQLHGAIGYTGEYPLGGMVRGCLALMAWLGSANALRRRFVAIERERKQAA
ncbi:MAG TPA: acyl-CoA dehydrogenase family protein [Novosphingobium sp.]